MEFSPDLPPAGLRSAAHRCVYTLRRMGFMPCRPDAPNGRLWRFPAQACICGLVGPMQQAGVELSHPPKPPPMAKLAIARAPKKPQAITVVPVDGLPAGR